MVLSCGCVNTYDSMALVLFGYVSPSQRSPTRRTAMSIKLCFGETRKSAFFFFFFFFLSPPRVSGGSILFVNHICVGIAVPLSRENTKFRAQWSHECTLESRRYVELDVFPSFQRWPVHLKLDAQLIGFPEWGYHHCRGLGCSADSGTDTSHRDFIFCYAADLIS